MDGEWVDFEDATVHVLTHTLHYGFGAFEGIRCYQIDETRGAFFRLSDHAERLLETCDIAGIEVPWERATIEDACVDVTVRNGFESSYVRPIVFLGHGEMGLGATGNPVRVAVACWEWGAYLGDEGLEHGIRAKVSSFERPGVDASMVKGKINGQYVNSILAKREARQLGFDEAIVLDADGYVSEASGENVFAVRDGALVTTPAAGSILEGITRETVVTLAEERGREVRERRFTRDYLYTADEVFMTGTAAEVTPVREIDGRTIGDGHPGPVTTELQEAYFDQVRGRAETHEQWRTYVDLG
ncbi:MAG: branched-chain amino acid transaminase [Bradymonadaceae bacterium]